MVCITLDSNTADVYIIKIQEKVHFQYKRTGRGTEGEGGGIIMSPVEEDKKEGCLSTIEIITEVRERFYTTFYSSYIVRPVNNRNRNATYTQSFVLKKKIVLEYACK